MPGRLRVARFQFCRTGIQRIFYQFLDGGGGAFDHLARGNAVNEGF